MTPAPLEDLRCAVYFLAMSLRELRGQLLEAERQLEEVRLRNASATHSTPVRRGDGARVFATPIDARQKQSL